MCFGNKGVISFTLFASLLALSPPVVIAQDFTTGVLLGTVLADDGNESQEASVKEPQSHTLIDYEQGDAPVITRVETFAPNQWRQVDGEYFICPGEFKDWSTFEDNEKCRVRDEGFNGWAGGTVPGQEQPIQKALEKQEGHPVKLSSIEFNGDTLTAKYHYVSSGQLTPSADEPDQEVQAEQESTQSDPEGSAGEDSSAERAGSSLSASGEDPFQDIHETMLLLLDSTFVKVLAVVMLLFGAASGIMRQSFSAFFMGVMPAIMIFNMPMVLETILGMDPETSSAGKAAGEAAEDGGSSMLWLVLIALPVVVLAILRFLQARRESELDELLRGYEGRQAGATNRPNDEPASLGELAQRQRDSTQASEPQVVSTASSAPKVKEEEPVELQPGKRKIILD